MKTEEQARKDIDKQLKKANWIIQDRQSINLSAGPGIAIREFNTKIGPVDYALFANRKAIGVVEAKSAGSTLSGVAEQTVGYGELGFKAIFEPKLQTSNTSLNKFAAA